MAKFTNFEKHALQTLARRRMMTHDEIQDHNINTDALECLEGQFSDQLVMQVIDYGWMITDEGAELADTIQEGDFK